LSCGSAIGCTRWASCTPAWRCTPAERAGEALRFYRDLVTAVPDEVSIVAGILTAPPEPFVPSQLQGRPVVLLAACYIGPVEDG
jgi:hypothetical protein